ncbi:hypothetical protein caldi_10270 [Caldinitratiruptor microaerophilus]|uniref:Uncharacterized protein n=1 Tax=Caldinitratiruptor microaerophilus TaxID=671077 RepID=A0AA35CLV9_9FIRM|nr:hypothetical protein caldi_10270 [Caldinitratiruptor microaerophilus]
MTADAEATANDSRAAYRLLSRTLDHPPLPWKPEGIRIPLPDPPAVCQSGTGTTQTVVPWTVTWAEPLSSPAGPVAVTVMA